MKWVWFAGTGRIIWLASIVKKQVRGMLQLVEFPLQDGGSVLIQVQDAAIEPVTRGLANHSVAERSQRTFEEAISRVQPAAQALLSRLRGLTDTPQEIGVEFGLELSAEAGAFIAAASTTANFKVTLTWRHLHPAAETSG